MSPLDLAINPLKSFSKLTVCLVILTAIYFSLEIVATNWSVTFAWSLIVIGMLAVGIPHGALDVATHSSRSNRLHPAYFILAYLLCIALVIGCWLTFPMLTLIGFVLLSAWHFGQADFELWQLKRGSWIWGLIVLSFILSWHLSATVPILHAMGVGQEFTSAWQQHEGLVKTITAGALMLSAFLATWLKKMDWLGAVMLIAATAWMPLLFGFALYFIGLHSTAGWTHLQSKLNRTAKELWWMALPYSAGAWFIFASGIWYWNDQHPADAEATVGAFFALLSSISIPHIIETHFFLRHRHHPL